MLYLGIDQHARQLTISLRDDHGDVLQARHVSTQPDKIQAFFAKLTRDLAQDGESFIAVVEVYGFNDWLIRLLRDYRCHKVILIQPEERKKRKTDRRDAAALSELLWVNRDRFLAGKPVRAFDIYETVVIASEKWFDPRLQHVVAFSSVVTIDGFAVSLASA